MATKKPPRDVKLVIVGDGAVGKTCCLATYTSKVFPEEYVPVVFENLTNSVNHSEGLVNLKLFDTAGQEDYDRIRHMTYPGTNIFIVAYSVDNRNSMENIQLKWLPEIKKYVANAVFMLVATKTDLRESLEADATISKEEGQEFGERIGAAAYFECSAKRLQGLDELFYAAILIAIKPKQNSTTKEEAAKSGGGGCGCDIM